MIIRFFLAIQILFFALGIPQNSFAQVSHLLGNLKTGPHAVGFRIGNEYDYARAYKPVMNKKNEVVKVSARPIQILIWYPAESRDNDSKIIFEEYLDLEIREENFADPSEDEKKKNIKEWAEYFASQGGADFNPDKLIKAQTTAIKNAEVVNGSFPLIVYGAGGYSPAFDNFVLCEYLASYGYIVVASPSAGMYSHEITINPIGLETQTRDMEFLIDFMHDFPSIDLNKLATMGWSWGGLAGMLLQMKNPNVDAVLSLDGSISVHEDKAKQSPFFNVSEMRVPYMFMSTRATLVELTQFFKKLKYSNAYLLDYHNLNHGEFGSLDYVIRNFVPNSEDVEMFQKRLAYELICRYALNFFDAYLKYNNESLAYLKSEHTKDNSVADLVTVMSKESLPLPPREWDFFELIRENGFDEAYSVYKVVKTRDPEYILFEEWNITNLAYMFFDDLNRKKEAIKIMKLNIEEYPKSYKTYGHLARLYEKNKEWKNALIYFSMAQGMALKEEKRPDASAREKDLAWYKRKVEKLKEKENHMIDVQKKATIHAPAKQVWKTIRDFNSLPSFISLIAKSTTEGEGVGAVRKLLFQNGLEAVETLEYLDDESMTLRYSLVDDPGLPFKGYVAMMKLVKIDAGSCELVWSSRFEAQGGATEEEAKAGPEGLYDDGIAGLKRMHEK